MGRYSYSTKDETDGLKKIETSFLKKYGYFSFGQHSGTLNWSINNEPTGSVSICTSISENEQFLRIVYSQTDNSTGEKKEFDYKIPLTTTRCNYGGKRYWFTCSLYKNKEYCGKRIGTLYKGGDYFGCRHCYELTYSSRKENRRYILMPLFNIFRIDAKIDELEKKIKRRTYAGVPTKNRGN
jgi:hypothetical protein